MRVLFTGLNGLTGSHLARLIINSEFLDKNVFASISREIKFDYLSLPARTLTRHQYIGSCENIEFLKNTIQEFKPDLIIHLAQIKLIKYIINAADITNFNGNIFVLGTTGVFSKFESCSLPYMQAESYLRRSNYNFQVIRSTLIYGSSYDKNFNKLFKAIKKGRIIPLPSGGTSLYQPIYYKDLAKIIFITNFCIPFKNGFYNCSGPDIVSLKQIVNYIEEISDKTIKKINLPLNFSYKVLLFLEKLLSIVNLNLPINSEQILRLKEDKVFQNNIDLGYKKFKLTKIKDGLLNQANEKYLS